ncbi:SH3 domain-containing protein [Pseudooceanicola sp. LIPI14-2-Ac024]|uniref:SH3 domain-containing protein n=1 Tax=Pseudooceanicola sp. LIPI14-2-Ac024 TaxID=3344875 RepID=UPI0035D0F37E
MIIRAVTGSTLACLLAFGITHSHGFAQDAAAPAVETAALAEASEAGPIGTDTARNLGPVTHLPLPRFVSMKARESNVRRGPSLTHRIDWVYTRQDMPLEIVAEFGHWRQVRDQDGMGGWVHYSLLSGSRTVLVQAASVDLLMRPDPRAKVVARLEQGVIARLGDCGPEWCQLRAESYRGWTRKDGLWGVGADEIRD